MKMLAVLVLLPGLLLATEFSEPYGVLDTAAVGVIQPFVPKHMQVIALAKGELNADGKDDYAVVVQATQPDLGKANPRRLLTVLSDADAEGGLRVTNQYWHFIPSPDAADAADPLSYIGIHDGLLEVKFVPAGAGRSHLTYTFKREGKRFVLDVFNQYKVNPNTGMFNETQVDVGKGTRLTTAGSMSSPRHRKSEDSFMPDRIWTPCFIRDPLHFEL